MAQIGTLQVSLRTETAWRGMTTLTIGERGDRRFQLLENAYINSDGSEIRTFPGWKCVADFRTTTGTNGSGVGFDRLTTDGVRAVSYLPGGGNYYENVAVNTTTAISESLACFARPTHLHGFEFVRGQLVIFGESDFRKEPILNSGNNAYVTISAVTVGANTTLTFSQNIELDAGAFNGIDVTTGNPQIIYIEGLTGANSATLNDKFHSVLSSPAANQIVIDTDTSATASTTGQTGYAYRVRPGTTAPGATGDTYYATSAGTRATDDPEALTTWQLQTAPSVSTMLHTGSSSGVLVSWVANRMRDFGDLTIAGGGVAYEGYIGSGISRRRQKRIPFRLVSDVAGERILLAAPGYGCCFQIPRLTGLDVSNGAEATPTSVGFPYRNNDIFDKPRCIGVPKAVMWEDEDKTDAASYHVVRSGSTLGDFNFGGSSLPARNGQYKFKVAYRDEATGEIGRCSEEIAITTGTTTAYEGIQLRVLHPGYLMGETLATSIVVFRTAMGGTTFYRCAIIGSRDLQSLRYGLQPATGLGTGASFFVYADIDIPYVSDADLAQDSTEVPTIIEQMPMGAKAVRTVRNFTFYGGSLGNSGPRREMFKTKVTTEYGGTTAEYPYHNEITMRAMTGLTNWFPADDTWMCASGSLSPAYKDNLSIFGITLYPFPVYHVEVGDLQNTVGQWDSGTPTSFNATALYTRYELRYSPLIQGRTRSGSAQRGLDCWASVPRGIFQISEADQPGVVDSHTNFVDAQKEEDIEAIGASGGAVVLCTRSNTFALNWSRSPFEDGVTPYLPDQVSDEFGCIAANSMVDFDGGCAWLSDRGPVAMTANGVEWIGRDLERFFVGETARYKRDSEGMMRHSWACHDAERGLVYFGLFANHQYGTASEVYVDFLGNRYLWDTNTQAVTDTVSIDQARSRFPCDEILVWSYRTNTWSRWVPPSGMEVLWMRRGYDADGAQRVFILCADWRLYALDDSYTDGNTNVLTLTASAAGTASTALTVAAASFGVNETARNGGTFLRVGTGVLIKSSTGEIKGYSTVTAADGSTGSITLATALTWAAGDTVYVGVREATITSNWINLTGSDGTATSRAAVLRYNLWGSGTATAAVKGTVTVNKRVEDSATSVTTNLHGDKQAEWLGADAITAQVNRSIKLSAGKAAGQELKVSFTIYHAGQVRLSDIAVEAP